MTLARAGHGVFTRHEARALGFDHRRIRTGVRSGEWAPGPGDTFVVAGAPEGRLFDIALAVKAAGVGALASHRTALELWGLGRETTPPSVLVPHGRRLRLDGVRIHQTRHFDERAATTRRGIACSPAADAVVDCAAIMTTTRLRATVDDAIAADLLGGESLAAAMTAALGQHRRGLERMAEVLDDFRPGAGMPTSTLEQKVLALYRRAQLEPSRTQFALPSRQRPDNLVDMVFLPERVINEIDGRRWHARVADRRRDVDRDWEAAKHGFVTVRTLAEHIDSDPAGVISDLRTVLDTRRTQLATP